MKVIGIESTLMSKGFDTEDGANRWLSQVNSGNPIELADLPESVIKAKGREAIRYGDIRKITSRGSVYGPSVIQMDGKYFGVIDVTDLEITTTTLDTEEEVLEALQDIADSGNDIKDDLIKKTASRLTGNGRSAVKKVANNTEHDLSEDARRVMLAVDTTR